MDYKMNSDYKMSEMKAKVDNYAKPEACFSQKYNQSPLNYIERNNSMQKHESSKLRGEAYQGRYGK